MTNDVILYKYACILYSYCISIHGFYIHTTVSD